MGSRPLSVRYVRRESEFHLGRFRRAGDTSAPKLVAPLPSAWIAFLPAWLASCSLPGPGRLNDSRNAAGIMTARRIVSAPERYRYSELKRRTEGPSRLTNCLPSCWRDQNTGCGNSDRLSSRLRSERFSWLVSSIGHL